jgi:hypothetical protein
LEVTLSVVFGEGAQYGAGRAGDLPVKSRRGQPLMECYAKTLAEREHVFIAEMLSIYSLLFVTIPTRYNNFLIALDQKRFSLSILVPLMV